jgi:hypothetical protein
MSRAVSAGRERASTGKVSTTRQSLADKGFIRLEYPENPAETNDTIRVTIIDKMAENINRYGSISVNLHSKPVHEVNTPVHEVNTPVHEVNTPVHEVNTPVHEVNERITLQEKLLRITLEEESASAQKPQTEKQNQILKDEDLGTRLRNRLTVLGGAK